MSVECVLPSPVTASAPADSKTTLNMRREQVSMNDYQRRLVERIKRGLDSSRRQWESRLQHKVDAYNAEVSPCCSPAVRRKNDVSQHEANQQITLSTNSLEVMSPEIVVHEPRVTILQCDRDTLAGDTCQWTIQVDVSDFLPHGEVVVSRGEDSVVICGQITTPCRRVPGRSRSSTPVEVKVTERVPLKANVSTYDLTATTSREGIMHIHVTGTAHQTAR